MKRVLSIVVVLALLGFGTSRAYDWWNYNVNTPASSASVRVAFHIDTGESPSDVGDNLFNLHLIRSTFAFYVYTKVTGAAPKLEAGNFVLNTNMTMAQIVDTLQHGNPDQTVVTLPEGFPIKFQADYVAKSGIGTAADYIKAAQDPTLATQFDFLSSRPSNANPPLEGYLFPDTYSVTNAGGVRELITSQLVQFGNVFSPDLRAQIKQATAARPAESIEAIVILASMVEREANSDSDRGNVCSVYYNRLKGNLPLGVDATLLYFLGRLTPEPTYYELTHDTETPYNTRTHTGLPPGPISNPGKAALLACINPPKTQYIHYFTDPNGVTHFQTSDAEFCRELVQYNMGHC